MPRFEKVSNKMGRRSRREPKRRQHQKRPSRHLRRSKKPLTSQQQERLTEARRTMLLGELLGVVQEQMGGLTKARAQRIIRNLGARDGADAAQ